MKSGIGKYGVLSVTLLAGVLLAGVGAHAQGIVGGAAKAPDPGRAVHQGHAAAAPVAAVGGVVVGGPLAADQRPRFHDYVVRERRPSHPYHEDLRVGLVLPPDSAPYYEVPAEYGVKGGAYTVINGHTVLVDPRTRQIVQIVD